MINCIKINHKKGHKMIKKLKMIWKIITAKKEEKSNFIMHAEREFKRAGYEPLDSEQENGPNKWIQENVMELLQVFASQGHSGSSAPFCVNMFQKLASYKLLGPVNSAEEFDFRDEEGRSRQSKTISAVFQDERGEYYIDAVVLNTKTGGWHGNAEHLGIPRHIYIKYPFTPKTFYIDVVEKEVAKDDWEFTELVDPSQLDALKEYYDLCPA